MACAKDTASGLDRLLTLGSVNIKQKSIGSKGNKYVVTTSGDELLFHLKEDGSALMAIIGSNHRAFDIDALDSQGRKVFSLRRPHEFVKDKVEVSMNGQLVSVVRKQPSLMKPVFSINDASDTPALRIKGNFGDYTFKLQNTYKQDIGYIRKEFRGVMTEMFSNKDSYVITFPADLDVRYKAAAIGACILIDYRYHET